LISSTVNSRNDRSDSTTVIVELFEQFKYGPIVELIDQFHSYSSTDRSDSTTVIVELFDQFKYGPIVELFYQFYYMHTMLSDGI